MIRAAEKMRDPVEFYEGRIHVSDAVVLGWSSLREVLRSWGIQNREQLTGWLRREGFQASLPGTTFPLEVKNFCSVKRARRTRGCL